MIKSVMRCSTASDSRFYQTSVTSYVNVGNLSPISHTTNTVQKNVVSVSPFDTTLLPVIYAILQVLLVLDTFSNHTIQSTIFAPTSFCLAMVHQFWLMSVLPVLNPKLWS